MTIFTETAARTIVEHAPNAGSITGTVIMVYAPIVCKYNQYYARNATHLLTAQI